MLNIEHLSFSYPDYSHPPGSGRELFRDLSLTVNEGETLLFLSPPDSGKSTLTKILSGGVPRYTSGKLAGSITLGSLDVLHTPPPKLISHLTCIFQNPQEQLLMNTLEDEIAFPLESMELSKEEIAGRIDRVLGDWNLSHLRNVHPQELSGGERKRVLFAVTDAIDAPVWILDEVFDDLDLFWKRRVLDLLKEKNKTTLLFASRFLQEFHGAFSRIVSLSDGHLLEVDEKELLSTPTSQGRSIPRRDTSSQATLLSVNGVLLEHSRKSERISHPFRLQVESLHLSQGEVIALVGENGAGKSTLARMLCGLADPLNGNCTIEGVPLSAKARRLKVAYLFQNPDFSIFLPTVEDELSFSVRKEGLSKKATLKKVQERASEFSLSLEDNPTLMSYGAKKRLQAAVASLLERPFIIIDEIDSGMTYEMAYESIELLRRRGAGVIIITHDPSIAQSLAERSYLIRDGKVSEEKNR